MKSEDEIRERYNEALELFVKTDFDNYLVELILLEDILEIPHAETRKNIKKELDKLNQKC
jgi:hypothetical protein